MDERVMGAYRIAESIDRLCNKLDDIADIVRYMANRNADDAKEGTERCLDTKSE